ncbi:MAG TPA: peptide deformylase [Coriobacteriia bacterium]
MEIFTHPNPALKQHAQEVEPATDSDLAHLVQAMAKAMYEAPGVGLAAPQVGVQKRVIVYDVDDGLVALVNPVVTPATSDTEVDEEGCLSLPGITVSVERPLAVVCEAVGVSGEPVLIEAEGLHARVLCHEVDHLDGTLIIDRAAPEERKAALRRYREAQEG